MFEEKAAKKGHSSLVTEAHKFVEELGTSLTLEHSDLSCNSHKGSEGLIEGTKVKEHLKKAAMDKLKKKTASPKSGMRICLLLPGKTRGCVRTDALLG